MKYLFTLLFTFCCCFVFSQIRVNPAISPNVREAAKPKDTMPQRQLRMPKSTTTPIFTGKINNLNYSYIYNSRIEFVNITEGGKEFGESTTTFSTKNNLTVYDKKAGWNVIVDWKKISRDVAYGKWQLSTLPFYSKEVKDIYILTEGEVKNNGSDSVRFNIKYKQPEFIITNAGSSKMANILKTINQNTNQKPADSKSRKEQLPYYNKASLDIAANNLNERTLYIRMLLFDKSNQPLEQYSNTIILKETIYEGLKGPVLTEEEKAAQKYVEERNADLKNLRDDYLITNIKYHPYFGGDPAYAGCTVVTGNTEGGMFNIPNGTVLCPKKSNDDGLFEKVFNTVTQFVQAVINGVSKFYNETKNYLKDKFKEFNCGNGGIAVVNPASKLNKLAGDEACEFISNVAFEAGMAAVGLPPSIPNTEQLMDMAKGQIVDVMCDKIEAETGVPLPEKVRDELKKELNKQIDKAKNEGTINEGGLKLKPHPLTLFKPVYMEFEITRVSKNYNKQLRLPVTFSVSDITTRDVSEYQKKVGSGLSILKDRLYDVAYPTIPYIENIGGKVTVYATLTPQNHRYLHIDDKGGIKTFSNVETYNQDYYHIYDDTYEQLIASSRAFQYLYHKESVTVFDVGLKKAGNVNVSFATSDK